MWGRTILVVTFFLIAIPQVAMSDNKPDREWGCEMSRFKSDGTKEDTIKKIFGLRSIVLESNRKAGWGNGFVTSLLWLGFRKMQMERGSVGRFSRNLKNL